MADFITIAGNPYDVVVGSARKLEPVRVGNPRRRMFGGRLRNTQRFAFVSAECTLGPLTGAQLVALRADVTPSLVPIAGEWLGVLKASVLIVNETPGEGHATLGAPPLEYFADITIEQAGPGQ